jgi:hypothetical protein
MLLRSTRSLRTPLHMLENSQYDFSKDKLPRAFSYPLKRSLLDAALNDASVMNAVYSVRYLFGRGKGPATIDALFSPERNGAHVSVSGKSLITVWAVPREERKACEDILIAAGLPILCEWLAQTSHAGNVWRSTSHDLSLVIQGCVLKHRES